MNKTLLAIGSLIVGGVSGFFIGKFVYAKKYKQISDKEISEVREAYKSYFSKKKSVKPTPQKPFETRSTLQETQPKETVVDYSEKYREEADQYRTASPVLDRKEQPANSKITVLTPEEFRESSKNAKTLIYYKDGVLADTFGNVIKDINSEVGPEALKTFGLYDDESVYVRNDNNDFDYEIIRSPKTYGDGTEQGRTLHPTDDDGILPPSIYDDDDDTLPPTYHDDDDYIRLYTKDDD